MLLIVFHLNNKLPALEPNDIKLTGVIAKDKDKLPDRDSRVQVIAAPNPNYTYDQSAAFSLGGGVDIDVTRNFRAKFDYQQQFEDFGQNAFTNDFALTPNGFTVGVVYRIPFKARQGYK